MMPLSDEESKVIDERIRLGVDYFKTIVERDCPISLDPIVENLEDAVIITGHSTAAYRKAPSAFRHKALSNWQQSVLKKKGLISPHSATYQDKISAVDEQFNRFQALHKKIERNILTASEGREYTYLSYNINGMLQKFTPLAITQSPLLSEVATRFSFVRHTPCEWECPLTRQKLPEDVSIQKVIKFMSPFLVAILRLALEEHHTLENACADPQYQDFFDFLKILKIDIHNEMSLKRLQYMALPVLRICLNHQCWGEGDLARYNAGFQPWQIKQLLTFLPPVTVLKTIMQSIEDEKTAAQVARALEAGPKAQNAMLHQFSIAPAMLLNEPSLLSQAAFATALASHINEQGNSHREVEEFWCYLSTLTMPHPRDPALSVSLESQELRKKYSVQYPDQIYQRYCEWRLQQNPSHRNRMP